MKEVTYVFPAGGATLETMAKNVMMQFGVGNSQQCLPPPQGTSECSQWQLEDGSYMRLGVDAYRRNMFLYLSRPKGPVAELVGIEGGVVSGVFNLESSGIEVPDWRPRHDKHYHEACFFAAKGREGC